MSQSQDIPYGYCQCGCGEPTPLASRTSTRDGTVKGRPGRFIHGHNARGQFTSVLERIANKYRVEDRGHDSPCWVWTASTSRTGYGMVRDAGRMRPAHRAVYEASRGPVPSTLEMDHLCRVRNCVNPDHLEPVTGAENQRRGANTKLTPDDVRAIRREHAALPRHKSGEAIKPGYMTAFAKRWGVTKTHIQNITNHVVWRDIEDAT